MGQICSAPFYLDKLRVVSIAANEKPTEKILYLKQFHIDNK